MRGPGPRSFHSRVTPNNPIWLKYGNFSTASNDNGHTTKLSLQSSRAAVIPLLRPLLFGYFSEIQNSNKLVQTQYPSDIQQKCSCIPVLLLVSCTHPDPWLVDSQWDTEPFLLQGLTWVIKAGLRYCPPETQSQIYKHSNSAGAGWWQLHRRSNIWFCD